ncbi:YozE SAM-like domain-containing protein, partial [Dysosmobacter welbionis]
SGDIPHGGGFGSRPGGAADEAVGGPGLLQPGQEPAEGRQDRGGAGRPVSGHLPGPAGPAGGGGLHRQRH